MLIKGIKRENVTGVNSFTFKKQENMPDTAMILWHADLLLGNNRERSSCTIAVTE
jgi:hypothetical protein